jgi:UDP-N-acetyl-D-mannosaminuronic acid dehydrogenase
MTFETISVVGLGYIGLPTAAVFASRKIKVIGVDVNQATVDTINRGEIHIVEPDLDMVVHAAVTEGYLWATVTPEPADAFLIAVPTPLRGDHEPDLSYIESAAKAIALVLKAGDLVILESTSPVGTTEQVSIWLSLARPDLTFPQAAGENSDIRIAHCPERVLPGCVLRELVQNDRVIGGMTDKCSTAAVTLYKTFVEGDCIVTNARTAEMAKLTENSFRDVNIAFANELSIICDKQGINVWELISLANRHPRVDILQPGPGVGGHCIAVDPWFVVSQSPKEARLIRSAREVNESKPEFVIEKVLQQALEFNAPVVACLGLAFKPDIDDLRQSPSLAIVERLAEKSELQIMVVEPNIVQLPESLRARNNVQLADLSQAVAASNVIVGLVKHKQFIDAIDEDAISQHKIVDLAKIISH